MWATYYTTLFLSLLLGCAASAQAQTPTPDNPPAGQTPAAAPAPPPPSPLRQWGTEFSFMLDGYVDKNFNDPPSGFNGLRNFDVRSNMPHVNMGMITIDHSPAPIGFHLDVGFGETFDVIHSGNRDPQAWKYFKQAYVSVKPKSWHGVELDAGEFVSSAGAEVIETNQNFNYSGSWSSVWPEPTPTLDFGCNTPSAPTSPGVFRWSTAGTTSNLL